MKPATLAIDPFDDAFLADPYADHDSLRDAGPVVWMEKLGVYAMARHGEVKGALHDHQTFCSGRGEGLSDFVREAPGVRGRCSSKLTYRSTRRPVG